MRKLQKQEQIQRKDTISAFRWRQNSKVWTVFGSLEVTSKIHLQLSLMGIGAAKVNKTDLWDCYWNNIKMLTSNDRNVSYVVNIIFLIKVISSIKVFKEWSYHLNVPLSLDHSEFILFFLSSPYLKTKTGCCKPLLLSPFQAFDMCDCNHSLSSPTGACKAQAWCLCVCRVSVVWLSVFAWWKLWEIRNWLCKANATRGSDVSVKTNTQNYSNFHLII